MSENLKAKIFWAKKKALMILGFKTGLIGCYSEHFIEKLREINYGGIPASALILNLPSCNQRCYDRALIACFGLKDLEYRMIDMDVNFIKYNPLVMKEVEELVEKGEKINPHYTNHCVVEFKENGRTWILDTTQGLVFEKHLYYLIESPVITKINSKKMVQRNPEYIDIELDSDHPGNPRFSTVVIPVIEKTIAQQDFVYKERLIREFDIYKEKIGYNDLFIKDQEERMEHGLISEETFKKNVEEFMSLNKRNKQVS